MDEVVKEILKIGLLPTLLLVIVFLIVQDSTRADKLKSLITKPFFRLFKWFSKSYISSEINASLNGFFNKNIYSYLIQNPNTKFKVKWVRKSKDPIFKNNGTLILRIRNEEDQTRNILSASKVALPHVICPLIRSNIDAHISSAIDLTIMKNLASKLGRHGKAIFKRHFLDPETIAEAQITDVLPKLIELDKHGIFTSIFLNELELVGDELYSESDYNNYSKETLKFIKYLLDIVNREKGSEIELNYISGPFKVGTILLAKSSRANSQGLRPYLRRLRMKIDKGCESIYLISFPNSYDFFKRIIKTVKSHESINLVKIVNTVDFGIDTNKAKENFKIAILSTNEISGSLSFKARIEANEIKEGKIYDGIVEDLSEKEALVNLLGLRAYVRKSECCWGIANDCREHLEINTEYKFKVKNIDFITGTILLSRKIDAENPWLLNEKPTIGERILVKINSSSLGNLYGVYNNLVVLIPENEISWFALTVDEISDFKERELEVKVNEIDNENFQVICSKKDIISNPWPEIHKLLPRGQEFNGKVLQVHQHFVKVEIDHSIVGILPKESLLKAGHEYANFVENMKIGQGIDVYVSKVFLNKKKIRLDLTRNK